eukprot:Amastigsp_a175720_87.p3 type:complete len:221 gc:universal Amastigsp_a175720_87:1963-2625(+)
MVRHRRRAALVHGVHDGLHGGRKAKGLVCAPHVVVDGLADADAREAAPGKVECAGLGPVAAHDDERAAPVRAESLEAQLGAVLGDVLAVRVLADDHVLGVDLVVRADDCAALVKNVLDIVQLEAAETVLEQPEEPVHDAPAGCAFCDHVRDDSPDHGVEAGAVTARRHHCNVKVVRVFLPNGGLCTLGAFAAEAVRVRRSEALALVDNGNVRRGHGVVSL